MSWTQSVNKFLAKNLSRWSTEFTALLTVSFSLLSLGLLDLWVIKTMLTIAMFLFFAGMTHKFILSMYKQHKEFLECLKDIKELEGTNEPNP